MPTDTKKLRHSPTSTMANLFEAVMLRIWDGVYNEDDFRTGPDGQVDPSQTVDNEDLLQMDTLNRGFYNSFHDAKETARNMGAKIAPRPLQGHEATFESGDLLALFLDGSKAIVAIDGAGCAALT